MRLLRSGTRMSARVGWAFFGFLLGLGFLSVVYASDSEGSTSGAKPEGLTWLVSPLLGLIGGGVAAQIVIYQLAGEQFRQRLVADLKLIIENREKYGPVILWQIREIERAQQNGSAPLSKAKFDLLLAGEYSIIGDIYSHVLHVHESAFQQAARCNFELGIVHEAKNTFNDELRKLTPGKVKARLDLLLSCARHLQVSYNRAIDHARRALKAIADQHPDTPNSMKHYMEQLQGRENRAPWELVEFEDLWAEEPATKFEMEIG